MKIIYHDKPFRFTKENYPLKDTFHVIDNYLEKNLWHWWDIQLVNSNIWSKTNQVSSDNQSGLPEHSFWGGTFFRGDRHLTPEDIGRGGVEKEDGLPRHIFYMPEFFDSKIRNDFGFEWVNFQYMGLNCQTQGLDGTCHYDSMEENEWNVSFLFYFNRFWNPNWGGDLRVYDKSVPGGVGKQMDKHEIGRVEFKPNRLLLFDGRIPHGAEAPRPNARYVDRRSLVLRGDEIRLVPKNEKKKELTPRNLRFKYFTNDGDPKKTDGWYL